MNHGPFFIHREHLISDGDHSQHRDPHQLSDAMHPRGSAENTEMLISPDGVDDDRQKELMQRLDQCSGKPSITCTSTQYTR